MTVNVEVAPNDCEEHAMIERKRLEEKALMWPNCGNKKKEDRKG